MSSKPKNTLNKSDWIRKQSPGLTAPEVAQKAADMGITITPGLVHVVRSEERRKATQKAAPASKPTARPSTAARSPKGDDDLEHQFRMLVINMGINDAEASMVALRAEAGI